MLTGWRARHSKRPIKICHENKDGNLNWRNCTFVIQADSSITYMLLSISLFSHSTNVINYLPKNILPCIANNMSKRHIFSYVNLTKQTEKWIHFVTISVKRLPATPVRPEAAPRRLVFSGRTFTLHFLPVSWRDSRVFRNIYALRHNIVSSVSLIIRRTFAIPACRVNYLNTWFQKGKRKKASVVIEYLQAFL